MDAKDLAGSQHVQEALDRARGDAEVGVVRTSLCVRTLLRDLAPQLLVKPVCGSPCLLVV